MLLIIILCVVLGVCLVTLVTSVIINKTKKLNSEAKFVHDLLPGLDCGKCGCKNCDEFSTDVADEYKDISGCPFIEPANLSKAKRVLKRSYVNNSNKIACIMCKGGKDCKNKFDYVGQQFCWCKESLYSGNKECNDACLGCGDCVKQCRYGAIFINEKGVAEVNREKCTGCGACTYVCPNNLIKLLPANQHVCVLCSNCTSKQKVKDFCKVGCTMCEKCVKVCPTGAIKIDKGNPIIDADKCIKCGKCVGVCPNSCISRL